MSGNDTPNVFAFGCLTTFATLLSGAYCLVNATSTQHKSAITVISQPNILGQLPRLMAIFVIVLAATPLLAASQVLLSWLSCHKRRARCFVTFAHEREKLAAELDPNYRPQQKVVKL